MNNGRKPTPERHPLQEPQRPAVLDVQRLVKRIFPSEEERSSHTDKVAAGKVLIQQDALPPYATAFLVVEGELVEEQRRVIDDEQKHFEVARIPAGAIAFRQGLVPGAEQRPSNVTVRAVTKGIICYVTDDALRRAGVDGELLIAETLVRTQFYDIIAEQRRALTASPEAARIGENFLKLLEKMRRRTGVVLKPGDFLKDLWNAYNNAQAGAAPSSTENVADLIAAQSERIARLERDLDAARKAGAQARTSLRDYMSEVDATVERQTATSNRTFGQMYSMFAKIQGYLAEQGADLRAIGITQEEIRIFSGIEMLAPKDKVGITVPPERIREAPTVPPQHDAPPSARPIPLIPKPKPLPPPEDDAYDSGRGTLIYDEVPFSDRDKTPPK